MLFHKVNRNRKSCLLFFCERPITKMQSTIDYHCLDNKCSQCSTAHCLFEKTKEPIFKKYYRSIL